MLFQAKSSFKENIKKMNIFAFPLIIQFTLNYIIGLIDQAFIGRISTEAFGAVGVVNSFLYMIGGIFGSLAVVLNIRAGNEIGLGRDEEFNYEFKSSFILSAFIGIVFFIFIHIFKSPILIFLYGFEGEALKAGADFFTYMSPYLLLQMLIFVFNQYFKVKDNTKWLLYGSLIASIINLVLDYLFVFGGLGFPKLGVKAAAFSTILGLFVNLLILIVKSDFKIDFNIRKLKDYFKIIKQQILESIPLFGQEILEGSFFAVIMNSIVTRIGILELSIYLILNQLINFLFVPMHMYGSATLTMSSKAFGSKNYDELKKLPMTGALLSMSFYIVMSVLYIAFRKYLPNIISDDKNVIEGASDLMIFIIITHIFNPVMTMYKNALIAMKEAKFVLYQTTIINIFTVAIVFIFVYIFHLGLYGVFLSSFLNSLLVFVLFYIKLKKVIKR